MSNARNDRQTYLGVGAAFFALAVAMWVTMDNWAIALPFATIAVTFTILGTQSKKSPGSGPKKPRGSADDDRV